MSFLTFKICIYKIIENYTDKNIICNINRNNYGHNFINPYITCINKFSNICYTLKCA